MTERVFRTQQLIDWKVTHSWEWDECEHVVNWTIVGPNDFETIAAIVFRAPDDGKIYRFEYEFNNGAGYNDITGISSEPYKPECNCFTAREVTAVTRLVEVTTYEDAP